MDEREYEYIIRTTIGYRCLDRKMKKEYVECRVTVTEAFELNWYPGFCKAVFLDTEGKEHIITDKLPVIGLEDEEVEYLPLQKSIRVKVVKDMGDTAEIDISEPDGLEDSEELTRFVVSKELLFCVEAE